MGAFRWLRDHYRAIQFGGGLVMVVLGLLLFFGRFYVLRIYVNRLFEWLGLDPVFYVGEPLVPPRAPSFWLRDPFTHDWPPGRQSRPPAANDISAATVQICVVDAAWVPQVTDCN